MSKFNMSRLMFLKSLANVSPGMRFHKIKDSIVVSQKNENIGFIYSFPADDFTFEGDEASFIDYKEFVSILNMLSSNAEMTQDEDDRRYLTFIDESENIKVSYKLTDEEVDLSEGPKKFDMGSIEGTIELNVTDFTKIKKFINAVSAEKVNVSIKSGTCTLKFYRDKKGDSCEMKFPCEGSDNFAYDITADFFSLSPEGTCRLDLKREGLLRLKYLNLDENVSLDIITGIFEE